MMNKKDMKKMVKTAEAQFKTLSKTLTALAKEEGVSVACEITGINGYDECDYLTINYHPPTPPRTSLLNCCIVED